MKPIGCYNKNSKKLIKEMVLCENCSTKLNSDSCKYMRNKDATGFLWLIEMY